ncbi:MAG: Glutaredoxin-like domain-containing protein PA3033, partial [uncultured Nocardioidaceae bacterium]
DALHQARVPPLRRREGGRRGGLRRARRGLDRGRHPVLRRALRTVRRGDPGDPRGRRAARLLEGGSRPAPRSAVATSL